MVGKNVLAVVVSFVALLFVGILVRKEGLRKLPGEQLVGSWKLVNEQTTSIDGTIVAIPKSSCNPIGILVYDHSGHVSAQLSRTGASPASSLGDGSNAVNCTAGKTEEYDAFFGTYMVDDASATVTHHLEGAVPLLDIGKDLDEHFLIEGSNLTLRFSLAEQGGTPIKRVQVWTRLP